MHYGDQTAREQKISAVLKNCIDNALATKEPWLKRANLLYRFAYSPDFDFIYTAHERDRRRRPFHRARVTKVHEGLDIFLPLISLQQGKREIQPRPFAAPNRKMQLEAMNSYLNFTPKQTRYWENHRRFCTDAILYGMGAKITGMDKQTKHVTSKWFDARYLLLDANAAVEEEMGWIGRVRHVNKWELMEENKDYPKSVERIRNLQTVKNRAGSGQSMQHHVISQLNDQSDMVEVVEMYFIHGLHRYKLEDGMAVFRDAIGQEDEIAGRYKEGVLRQSLLEEGDDTPKKYLCDINGKLLCEKDWEIPFHQDKQARFPITILRASDNNSGLWANSLFEPGLGYLEMMNWVLSYMMGKFRFTSKTLLAFKKQGAGDLKQEDIGKFYYGEDISAIAIKAKGNSSLTLKHFLEKFEFSQEWLNYAMAFYDKLEDLFSKASGLYSIMYTGEGESQSRSAEDARQRGLFSRQRIEDLRDQVIQREGDCARRESFCSRYLLKSDDVAPYIGPQLAQAWGELVPQADLDDPGSLMRGELGSFARRMVETGVDPAVAQMGFESLQNPVSIEQWTEAADYEIAVNTTTRPDPERNREAAGKMMELLPHLFRAEQIPEALALMHEFADAHDMQPRILEILQAAVQQSQQARQAAMQQGQHQAQVQEQLAQHEAQISDRQTRVQEMTGEANMLSSQAKMVAAMGKNEEGAAKIRNEAVKIAVDAAKNEADAQKPSPKE